MIQQTSYQRTIVIMEQSATEFLCRKISPCNLSSEATSGATPKAGGARAKEDKK